MPTHRDAADATHFQPPSVQTKAVAILLEPKAGEAVAPLEPWITGLLSGFDPAKERVKGSLQVGAHELQDVAVHPRSEGTFGLAGFDLAQLVGIRDTPANKLKGCFALGETVVVPAWRRLTR